MTANNALLPLAAYDSLFALMCLIVAMYATRIRWW